MTLDSRALADRLHNGPLQLLGAALFKTEMCEQLLALNRGEELPARLVELRAALEQATEDLRAIMTDLRHDTTHP